MYAFHHVPKCAGSTLQYRMILAEHEGELQVGSTLVRYDAGGRQWDYKIKDDPMYNAKESLHEQTFPRHRGMQVDPDHSDVIIGMGHAIDHTWPGQHITWIRNPYDRDVSHYNYDYNLGRINRTWEEWHWQMPPDWMLLWLYTKWLKMPETDAQTMYETIINSKLVIRPIETFESDYAIICEKLGIKCRTVRDNVQTDKHLTQKDLDCYSVEEHQDDNEYDWLLYDSSVRHSSLLIHP